MWMTLLANKWTKLAGICVLCLALGYMKGCSTGYEKGEAKVQGKFDEYKTQLAEDLANAQAAVLTEVQERAKAQSELALLQSKRRDELKESLNEVKRKIEGFRIRLDDNCRPTDHELWVVQEALGKSRAGQ